MYIVAKVKKQDPVEISDYIAPGLLLAQSIGRWGNFVNQEAYGNLITNPAHQWFPLAVKVGENYYQATFFYESVCTLIGFVLVAQQALPQGACCGFLRNILRNRAPCHRGTAFGQSVSVAGRLQYGNQNFSAGFVHYYNSRHI